jgi:hypothetical protein
LQRIHPSLKITIDITLNFSNVKISQIIINGVQMNTLLVKNSFVRTAAWAAVLGGSLALVACGGGSESDACSTATSLSITGTTYPTGTIVAKIGVPTAKYTPALVGIPASCQAGARYQLTSFQIHRAPAGISLDPATGTVSGTPTVLSATAPLPGSSTVLTDGFSIELKLPGYSAMSLGNIRFQIVP